MTIASDSGQGDPTLVLMHFFGSSHHEWEAVLPLLDDRYRVVTLDMPGFGRASEVSLAPTLYQQAVEDAINANPAEWRAWPMTTYAEDWRETVGKLSYPAWVLVGDQDPSLPPETQRAEVMPHLPQGKLEVFPGYGHLLPMEMPETLAEQLNAIAAQLTKNR